MPRAITNLDLELVRTFVTIAGMGNFTRAGETLRRQQSTISLQIQRLEDALGQKLFERNPRSVRLTCEGRIFLGYATRLLDLNDDLVSRVTDPQMQGVVRMGTPENFATCHLTEPLARFVQAYPAVELDVTCDPTLNLLDRFRKKAFDLAFVRQERCADAGGIRVWREPLVWVTSDHAFLSIKGSVPLVASPAPCVFRKRAIEGLAKIGRSWRIAYTCGSLAGSLAAVKAGLGITVLPRNMAPVDLCVIDGRKFPKLRDTEIALLQAERLSIPAQRLKEHVIRSLAKSA